MDDETPAFVTLGRDNPNGWKLEDLLLQVGDEIGVKTRYFGNDISAVATVVRGNNQEIRRLLYKAAMVQFRSTALLDQLSKDTGPLGPYRIGAVEVTDPLMPPEGNRRPGTLHYLSHVDEGAMMFRWLGTDEATWRWQRPAHPLRSATLSDDLGSPIVLSAKVYSYLHPVGGPL